MTSLHKRINENKKIYLSKNNEGNLNNINNKHQRTSPKNFTFKTVFFNNFCLMPMSPSFIDKNNQYSNISINQQNYTSRGPDNFSNYNKSVFFDEEKGIHFISSNIKNNPQYSKNRKPQLNNINFNSDNNSFFINMNHRKNLKNLINEVNSKNKLDLIKKNKKKDNPKNNRNKDNKNNKKVNNFNEEYYCTTMDFSKVDIIRREDSNKLKNKNNDKRNNNKKHVQFNLTKNVLFLYNDNDYISYYKTIPENQKRGTKNLRKKIKPIIMKYNKQEIKIDKNYIYKENLSEAEILSKSIKLDDDSGV